MQRAAGGCGHALEVVGVVAKHYAEVFAFYCCHFILIFRDQRVNRWALWLMKTLPLMLRGGRDDERHFIFRDSNARG
jgi:hypothetical protein